MVEPSSVTDRIDQGSVIPGTPAKGALATWLRFLIGDAAAIRDLAATPRLWLVGLLLTVGAGLAREYDAEDLTREPWHLLIAPGASLAAATVLWLLVQLSGLRHWRRPQVGAAAEPPAPADDEDPPRSARAVWNPSGYLPFLGLFWLTAPLAWLYGIPYERFLSPVDAAVANLWMLKLVAAWRVVLIIRVLCVLWRIPAWMSTVMVLLFSDAVTLTALAWLPVPVFVFMGGIRLDPAEAVISNQVFVAQILGSLALLPLILAWLITLAFRGGPWGAKVPGRALRLRGLTLVGALACLWWCCWLPLTQPEQRLKTRVEQAMIDGDFATGLALMERHHPQDLPAHWDPPPRIAYAQPRPDPLAVLLFMTTNETPERLQRLYEGKLYRWGHSYHMPDERKPGVVTLLERQHDASRLMNHYRDELLRTLRPDSQTPEALKTRIKALLERYPERQP